MPTPETMDLIRDVLKLMAIIIWTTGVLLWRYTRMFDDE